MRWNFQWRMASSLVKDSWPLILSGFSVMIYMRIDQILLKEMVGADAVGQYAVAVRLSEVWYFVPGVICVSLFPAILNMRQNHALYVARLQRLYDLMAMLSIGVACVVTLLGSTIVTFLYGEAYAPAGIAFSILIWAGVFVALGLANHRWLIAENYTKVSMTNTSLGALTNLTLNLLLIPRLGIIGAAIATVVAQLCTSYLFLLLHKKCWVSFKQLTTALFLPASFLRNIKYIGNH
jgi:O-antigen/teichoic acid export membrane protein